MWQVGIIGFLLAVILSVSWNISPRLEFWIGWNFYHLFDKFCSFRFPFLVAWSALWLPYSGENSIYWPREGYGALASCMSWSINSYCTQMSTSEPSHTCCRLKGTNACLKAMANQNVLDIYTYEGLLYNKTYCKIQKSKLTSQFNLLTVGGPFSSPKA